MVSITAEQYLSLSALAYSDLSQFTERSLGEVIAKANGQKGHAREIVKGYKLDSGPVSPEFHALSSLSSWTLIAQSPVATSRIVTQRGRTRKVSIEIDFSAIALKNPETGEIVFAFRGTNNMGDWDTDVAIAGGVHHLLVDQFARAKSFVFDVMNKFGPICYESQEQMFKDIGERGGVSFTGHSLGGALAQYIAYKTDRRATTFNAPGVGLKVESVVGRDYLFYKHPAYGML